MSKDYMAAAVKIAAMLELKNQEYGDWETTTKVILALYPEGIKPNQYDSVLAVIRVIDKLRRISQGHSKDSWEDIIGYGLQMVVNEPNLSGLTICDKCGIETKSPKWGMTTCKTCATAKEQVMEKQTKLCAGCTCEIQFLSEQITLSTGQHVHKWCWCEKCKTIRDPGANMIEQNDRWEHIECPEIPKDSDQSTTSRSDSDF